jgi:hypothetical protein
MRANLLNRRHATRQYSARVPIDTPVRPAEPQATNLSGPVIALSGLMLTAGTIHLVAAAQHLDLRWPLPTFFALLGAAQLYAAWGLHERPDDRRLLMLAAAGSIVIALLWLFSRTTGLPFGPEQGRSKVGVADTIATVQELAFAAVAIALLRAPARAGERLAWLAGPIGLRVSFMILPAMLFVAALGGHKH